MLPIMPGPSPEALGALALVLALGTGGAIVAAAAFVGFHAQEIVCFLEHYANA
ncbi:hypothetical protein [Aureimonas sp. SK2]|uniref:hypothetical protein n=1 Tax=Aureimonas sp. SK2 TaxID=3015992 RepID=UPI0024442526|nr:hypothetical protein [Aureimonas sp. SK2]